MQVESFSQLKHYAHRIYICVAPFSIEFQVHVGSVHARSLTGAYTCTLAVMYMSTGHFLHSPESLHIYAKVSGAEKFCMEDTIASATGMGNFSDLGSNNFR